MSSSPPTDAWATVPHRLRRSGEQLAPGVWWVEHETVGPSRARALLLDEDFQVIPVQGADLRDLRAAQAAVAAALRLPGSAAVNLDGLADALRDLDLWWPRTRRIALLWSDADTLRDHDREGFDELVSILSEAHTHLWQSDRQDEGPGDEHERVLETVLVPSGTTSPLDPTDPSVH
ncbi:barstar family protein [Arsenicicoccus dermatophilus]|uniref:barstar family protein n=1 Tax=Arsenicicoccus dermatophilus TaxID=1076331 RepID=UPI003916EEB6